MDPEVSEPIPNGTNPAATAPVPSAASATVPGGPGVLAGALQGRGGIAVSAPAGERHHREFGDEHRPRPAQPLDHRRIVVEGLAGVRPRPPRGGRSPDGQQILGAVRDSHERPEKTPILERPVCRPGLAQRPLAEDAGHGVVPGPEGLEPVEGDPGQFHR